MVTVVSEILDIALCFGLKIPQYFEGWICIHLQVGWQRGECTLVGPLEIVSNPGHVHMNMEADPASKIL
jgi:hypothetical protein